MAKAFTFDFNGKNSKDMGIYARSYDFFMPPKREKRKKIPFMHGTHDYGAAFFDDRELRIKCFWFNNKLENLSRADIREITFWLSRKGRIVLDCEPDKHYIGELYDPAALEMHYDMAREDIRSTDGGFYLSFVCEPFAHGAQIIMPIQRGENPVEYMGTAESPTLIVLRNPNSFPISSIRITALSRKTPV
ncbi:MAG: hypothetical protein FWE19_00585 [Oscillospiraceae bacterium]|nr:hypothetical protein [Oscillospiraceae bacterium]